MYTTEEDLLINENGERVKEGASGASVLVRKGQVMSDAQAGFYGLLTPAQDTADKAKREVKPTKSE